MAAWNDWPDGEVLRDGVPLHYYRTGDRAKPPVVLLHGFTDFGLCWARVATDLATEYDLVMLDAVGHGRSGGAGCGFRERAVGDVLAVIADLGLARPALIGHSMGAGTAAGVGAAAPEAIRALVLEDPGWRDAASPVPPAPTADADARPDSRAPLGSPAWLAWVREFKALRPEERCARSAAERPGWSEAERLPWADAKALLDLAVFDEPRAAGTTAWRELADRISCPVLLLTADPARGGIVTPAVAAAALEHLRDGCVVNLPDAGHNIRREAYAPYLAAVREFLRETA